MWKHIEDSEVSFNANDYCSLVNRYIHINNEETKKEITLLLNDQLINYKHPSQNKGITWIIGEKVHGYHFDYDIYDAIDYIFTECGLFYG